MKEYVCHKRVHAARIVAVEDHLLENGRKSGCLTLTMESGLDDGSVTQTVIGRDMIARYIPVAGDYLVEYKGGYLSISPREAFEDGYSLAGETPDMVTFEQARQDVAILLGNIRFLEDVLGEGLEDDDAALVRDIAGAYGIKREPPAPPPPEADEEARRQEGGDEG